MNKVIVMLLSCFFVSSSHANTTNEKDRLLKCYVRLSDGSHTVVNIYEKKKNALHKIKIPSQTTGKLLKITFISECQAQNGRFKNRQARKTERNTPQ